MYAVCIQIKEAEEMEIFLASSQSQTLEKKTESHESLKGVWFLFFCSCY